MAERFLSSFSIWVSFFSITNPESPASIQVQIEVQTYFVQDQLKGDSVNEIKVKFLRKLYDALPAGEN